LILRAAEGCGKLAGGRAGASRNPKSRVAAAF
jgi:hypothetical protein